MIITVHDHEDGGVQEQRQREHQRQRSKPRNPNNDIRLATVDELLETARRVVEDMTNGVDNDGGGDDDAESRSGSGSLSTYSHHSNNNNHNNHKQRRRLLQGIHAEQQVPQFADREIVRGSVIGRGGFCVVRDIDKFRLPKRHMSMSSLKSGSGSIGGSNSDAGVGDVYITTGGSSGGIFGMCLPKRKKNINTSNSNNNNSNSNTQKDLRNQSQHNTGFTKSVASSGGYEGPTKERVTRDVVAQRAKQKNRRKNGGGGGARYVLKSLNKDVDKITYMKGNVDIAMEAKFLTALDHPNIIDLVAVSQSKPCTPGYFLILEKMVDTLGGRIKTWMDRERLYKGVVGFFANGKRKELELYHERLAAAYDIASGLFYLHSNNVIYRDLKPANIGFDTQGQLKLFDFGLAKELKEKDRRRDGTYKNMTSMTGAVRYMAPEVSLGQAYNTTADVYSWSMVMWYILALEPPFGFFTESMIANRVHRKGVRPAIFRKWEDQSPVLGEMLRCAWDPDLHQRPNLLEVTLVLKQELIAADAAASIAGPTDIGGGGGGSTAAGTSNSSVGAGSTFEPLNGISLSKRSTSSHMEDHQGHASISSRQSKRS